MIEAYNRAGKDTDDPCDKCKKPMTKENQGVTLWQSSRGNNRNVIVLHYKCLDRLIHKAQAETAPAVDQEQQQSISA